MRAGTVGLRRSDRRRGAGKGASDALRTGMATALRAGLGATIRRTAIAAVSLLILGVASAPVAAQTVAIVGGTVHPVSGPAIENGVVVVEDGRITMVGPLAAVQLPADIPTIDATGRVVTPGFFDAATQTGLVEVGSVGATRDASADGDPVRAAFRVSEGINPRSVVIPVTRTGGVTTVVSAPSGGAVAGQAAILDLAGESLGDMLVRDPAALYAAFNPDAAEEVGGARGELALRLRELLEDARFYRENQSAYGRGASRPLSASRLDLDAVLRVLDGEIPMVARASRASDIEAALGIAVEYGIDLVIEGGEEAWRIADRLAEADVPVILKPMINLPTQFDRLGTRFENAALLEEAGVDVILSTMDTHNARLLPQEAGNAVRFGMPWEAALRAVTLAPAEAFGVPEDHGSLEPGKVANVVVWSGDPFELSSVPEAVLIRGERIDLDSRQKRLLERYLELGRELPPAYRGREPGR